MDNIECERMGVIATETKGEDFKIRFYQSGDAYKQDLREVFDDRGFLDKHKFHKHLERIKDKCVLIVAESAASEIVSIVVFSFLWRGVADVALFTSPIFDKFPEDVGRVAKDVLRYMEEVHKLHRIQAMIRASIPAALEFVIELQFQKEGYLKKYTPDGEDYLLVARTAEVKRWRDM